MAAIEEQIKKLKLKGAKNFIIVSHLGLEPDIILAQKLLALGIDNCVILGGHSHTLTEKPVAITQDGRTVTIFNGGARAENCIAVNLDVTDGKLRFEEETLLSSRGWPLHPEIERVVASYSDQVKETTGLNLEDLQKEIFFSLRTNIAGSEFAADLLGCVRVSDSFLTRLTADALAASASVEEKKAIGLLPALFIIANKS